MNDTAQTATILDIIDRHRGKRGDVIAILEDIQASYNYLPRSALEIVAKRTGHPLVDIYGIATFYTAFSLEPRGKHLLSLCMGTACHVRGAPAVLEELTKRLQVAPGQTTHDKTITLTTVNCLGACALGPVAVKDGEYCRNVTKKRVPGLIEACCQDDGAYQNGDPEETIHLHALCPSCNRSLMQPEHKLDGFPMIHVTVSSGSGHGWLRLSSVWGDPRIRSEHSIEKDTLLQFFCPRCHAELRSPRLCPKCDAATIPLLNKEGGIITLCSRHGCKEHLLDLS